jgi:hypothetical protein
MKRKVTWVSKIITLIIGIAAFPVFSFAQNPTDSLPGDPGLVTIYTVQNMSFGAFTTTGGGGTVTVSNSGTRTVTGSVTPLNLGQAYYPSIFEIDAPAGTIISILNGPAATLTGSNGGSLSVAIGSSQPASPFSTTVIQPARTQVNIGGTLTVGNSASSPPGSYSGSISITFNYQ